MMGFPASRPSSPVVFSTKYIYIKYQNKIDFEQNGLHTFLSQVSVVYVITNRAWREEVEGRQDLGNYKDRQLVLERADYIANSSGDKIRAEIKGKCEWGEHFQI